MISAIINLNFLVNKLCAGVLCKKYVIATNFLVLVIKHMIFKKQKLVHIQEQYLI